jgi:SPP1 gp7 family putative phage head morphogenesis protein
MFDVMASYSIGSASDRFRLIEDTCMPLGVKLCESIGRIASTQTSSTVECYLDWKEHSVMQQVRSERLKEIDTLWSKGMPLEEISEYLNLDLPEFDGWDVGYLPFNVAPAGENAEPATDPASNPQFAEPEEPEPKDDVEKMLHVLTPGHQCCGEPTHRTAKELAIWKKHMSQRRSLIKTYESKFNRVLMKARSEVLAKVEKHSKMQTRVGVAADFMFDLTGFSKDLVASMRAVARTGLQIAGDQLYQELSKDDPFKYPPEKVLNFLAKRDNRMSGVADEVYKEVNATVEESLVKGDSIADMAKAIRERFNGISKGRATMVAMTETSAVYGQGRQDAMLEAGVQYKEWLTSGNDNVRPAHEEANGQIVRIEEEFEVGEEKLMHPGDPDGSPENVINCHCVSIPVAGPDGGEVSAAEL